MKLLFIAPSAYLLGGVQDWLYTLVLELRRKGHSIEVAIPKDRYHNGDLYNQFYEGIDAIYFSNYTCSTQGRINALSQLMLRYPVDIIVGVNIGDIYEAYKKVRGKLKYTKLVMTLHALEIEYLRDIGKYTHLLDGVITTNRLSQRIVTQLDLLSENRVFYAPYGVYKKSAVSKRNNDNVLRIAWVGRLENQQKRIKDLVHIARYLDTNHMACKFSIAGDGPFRAQIEKDLDNEIRKNKVELVGFLDKPNLHSFYQNHDVLLITSEWETGPIVAWEAMLSGLVIVSSTYVGSVLERSLINEETALLFPIGAIETAGKQICRLTDHTLRKKLSKNAACMAESRYLLDTSLASWEEAFQTIISLEPREEKIYDARKPSGHTSRLDSLLGTRVAEFIRLKLRRKGYCRDPGSEWPHSCSNKNTSKPLLRYGKLLEENA
ncbi:MAG: glycosyltransferase family 4 protein [Cyanobacteriota bacterium]